MMNRRSFLSTLAAVPGLGWLKPQTGIVPMECTGTVTNYAFTEQEPAWPAPQMFVVVRIDAVEGSVLREVTFRNAETGETIRTIESPDHSLTVGDYVEWSRTLQQWTPPPYPCPFTVLR